MNQAPDMQVRQEALDTRRSFILEAPAGSGKTALLTARFLALLADVRHPRQIMAVTFTRKAAAEMADRIIRTLRQAQDNRVTAPPGSWEAHLLDLARQALKIHPGWDVLLRNPDAFLVDTFHGFCGQVARNWPLESRTPPSFVLLDEIGQETVLDTAVAEYIHAFAVGDSRLDPAEIAAFMRRMAAANNNVRVISSQLSDLLARRDRLGSLLAIFQHPLAENEIARRTERLAEQYLSRLHDYFCGHLDSWRALSRHLDAIRGTEGRSDERQLHQSRSDERQLHQSRSGERQLHQSRSGERQLHQSRSGERQLHQVRSDEPQLHQCSCGSIEPLRIENHFHEHTTESAANFPKEIPGTTLRDLPAWQSAADVFLVKSGTPRKQFKPAEFGQNFTKTTMADFIRELPAEIALILNFVREWQVSGDAAGFEALSDCMRLAIGALERFGKLMNTRGLDFVELELAALRAFSAIGGSASGGNQGYCPSDSLIFFHEHLRHILVDEAQDMNDNQVRILSTLTEGWDPDDGRTVFIVGDPKQSIFRFRRAEVSIFEALKTNGLFRRGEAPLPLKALNLKANFRSRPQLVAFTNAAFARVMQSPQRAFDETAFNASEPARGELACTEPRRSVESARDKHAAPKPITLATFNCRQANSRQTTFPLKSEAREQEARYVADRVAALCLADQAASIAILIPARTHLTPYVRAMEARAIPIRLMEGVPMLDCPEVRHKLNLFKALLRPHDDVAWAGALRAPWCRVPAAALEKLAALQAPARWSAKITGPGRQDHPEILRFNAALDIIRPDFGRESYAISLQRLWEELGGPAAVVRLYGPTGLANSMRLLDLLGQCPEGRGEETLDILERLLDRAYTPPDPRAAFSPISIMTIHKAKGLEFDHVFAVGLDREAGGRTARRERDTAFLMERLPAGQDRQEPQLSRSNERQLHLCSRGSLEPLRIEIPMHQDRRPEAAALEAARGAHGPPYSADSKVGASRPLGESGRAAHSAPPTTIEFLAAVSGDRRTDARSLAQLLLSDLGLRRSAAEYKRLIYVAATRARETITFSGLIPQSSDAKTRPSAIAWLDSMNREDVFKGLPIEALYDPQPSGTKTPVITPPKPAPAPAPFDPEPLPYLIKSPSKIEDETATAARSGADEPDPNARARGVVMHRLFETLARGKPAPSATAIAAALAAECLAPAQCHALAKEIIDECRQAWEFETFTELRKAATEIIPEWAGEDCVAKKVVRVGRIDLLLKIANGIILVDFKTGRPGPDSVSWLTAEIDRYRPQLAAYREMAARALDMPSARIRTVLFFTALPRLEAIY